MMSSVIKFHSSLVCTRLCLQKPQSKINKHHLPLQISEQRCLPPSRRRVVLWGRETRDPGSLWVASSLRCKFHRYTFGFNLKISCDLVTQKC